ncbi:MAG: SDR family oxidoreductase [Proteobacteria bacterium]|nr:MAG: SDR family oxidoreductase [Pseudomonadota bacterium]
MNVLQNKVALVTGGNSGIGLAIAKQYIKEGAKVIVTARRKAQLDEAVKELGSNAFGIVSDVTKLADLDAVFATIKEKYGKLDIVVANAGGGTLAPLGEITEESYYKTFDTNVKGVIFTVQKALPLLQRGSSVVIIGSTTSIKGTPAFSIYSATKAAVRNLVRSWILDLKGSGIRVNVLSPGSTLTPGLLGVAPEGQQDEFIESFKSMIPAGRIADADEIAQVAVFLASEASSYVNGAEYFVDGGLAQV